MEKEKEYVLERISWFIRNKLDNEPEFFLDNIIVIDAHSFINISFYNISENKYLEVLDIEGLIDKSIGETKYIQLLSEKDSINMLDKFDDFLSTDKHDPYGNNCAYIYKPLLKTVTVANSNKKITFVIPGGYSTKVCIKFKYVCFYISLRKITGILSADELKTFNKKRNFLKAIELKNDFNYVNKKFKQTKEELESVSKKYERILKKLSPEEKLLLEIDEE